MKIVLIQDVYKHGVAGEVVNVADGFARNYLIPKKLAVRASAKALEESEALRMQAASRKAALDNRLNELARQINGVELVFGRRASPTGKLFGSVTTSEIAEALNEATGIDINRRRVSTALPREVGTHDIPVRLGTEISPILKVTIVREEEYSRFMAARALRLAEEAEAANAPAVEGEVVAAADDTSAATPDTESVAE